MNDERKHSIDKLFHESLKGDEINPSPGVWTSLEHYIPQGAVTGLMRYLLSAVAIGILSVGLTGILFDEPEAIAPGGHAAAVSPPAEEPLPAEAAESDTPAMAEGTASAITEAQSANMNPVLSVENSTSGNEMLAPAPVASVLQKQPSTQSHDNIARHQLPALPAQAGFVSCDSPGAATEMCSVEGIEPIFTQLLKDDYVRSADLWVGAGFSPAVNIYPEGQNRNDFSAELLLAYERSRFIAEGGLGINYTTESARYGVRYSSYDSVGYFINVSSFTENPEVPGTVLFETNTKGVYDSIERIRVEEKTNKYAYIQLPLRAGYRLVDKGRFSVDLKVGVIFSLQVYRDVPEIPFEGNDVERIEVIRAYPDRLKTHWQYTTSLGLNYYFSRKTRLSVEPFYRQYINSVYSAGSELPARSPYAFGISGTLYFHF